MQGGNIPRIPEGQSRISHWARTEEGELDGEEGERGVGKLIAIRCQFSLSLWRGLSRSALEMYEIVCPLF